MSWPIDGETTEAPASPVEPAPAPPSVEERLAALEAEVAALAFRIKQHLG